MSTTTPTRIQVIARHRSSGEAQALIRACSAAGEEVSAAVAVTIASWWQSSGSVGHELAAFASGAEVSRTALLDDIHSTRRQEGYYNGTMSDEDKLALDMLSTFVLNYRPSVIA